ncbi:MAG: TetR/AcrR family transcriptional regulator [Mycobacteriales bacterium]
MPRVSQQHLDARRRQILAAAWRCFVRDGFHQTSMQDILAEAGVSAGAFYRYFTGKHELIRTIALEAITDLRATLADLKAAEPPPSLPEALERITDSVIALQGRPEDPTLIALQAWAESHRDPELREFFDGVFAGIQVDYATVVARAQASGRYPADADPDAVGRVLFGLAQGFMLQRLLIGPHITDQYRAGLTALLAK